MFLIKRQRHFCKHPKLFNRTFYTNPLLLKELEKVPKEETDFERALREAREDSEKTKTDVAPVVKKKSLWMRVKEEGMHYWHGTKLLAAETSISSRLLMKTLKGKELTRREYRQLKRTTGDLLRVVPLVIILIVPFLEFALPVLLKLFPSMLPSTFESKFQEEERKKNILKVRIQMAKFLQETVGEVALAGTSKTDAAKEFNDFFHQARMSGKPAKPEDILNVARKFQDELTLNNLSRPQLVSLARFMSINSFGTDAFLRVSIDNKLKSIARDDRMILADGVDSLSISELQSACLVRGLSFNGVSPNRMRTELQQWLDLHLVHKVPSSLLLLSNAFQTTSRPFLSGAGTLEDKAEALQATLSSLPHQVINEASLKISEQEGIATNKQKLDVLKEQEELIADELEQELIVSEIKKEQESIAAKEKEVKVEEAPKIISDQTGEGEPKPQTTDDHDGELSEEELKKLADALQTMSSDSALTDVKETLESLKEDRQDFIEDVEEYKQFTRKETPVVSDRLGSRVDKMINSIEQELRKYDSEIGSKLNLVKPNQSGQISIQELEEALRVIRDHPNDERISKIVKKLDADCDGFVPMNEILALAGKEVKSEGKPEDKPLQ